MRVLWAVTLFALLAVVLATPFTHQHPHIQTHSSLSVKADRDSSTSDLLREAQILEEDEVGVEVTLGNTRVNVVGWSSSWTSPNAIYNEARQKADEITETFMAIRENPELAFEVGFLGAIVDLVGTTVKDRFRNILRALTDSEAVPSESSKIRAANAVIKYLEDEGTKIGSTHRLAVESGKRYKEYAQRELALIRGALDDRSRDGFQALNMIEQQIERFGEQVTFAEFRALVSVATYVMKDRLEQGFLSTEFMYRAALYGYYGSLNRQADEILHRLMIDDSPLRRHFCSSDAIRPSRDLYDRIYQTCSPLDQLELIEEASQEIVKYIRLKTPDSDAANDDMLPEMVEVLSCIPYPQIVTVAETIKAVGSEFQFPDQVNGMRGYASVQYQSALAAVAQEIMCPSSARERREDGDEVRAPKLVVKPAVRKGDGLFDGLLSGFCVGSRK